MADELILRKGGFVQHWKWVKNDWKLYKVFTTPEQVLFSYKVFSGDYNGDGLSDFLVYDGFMLPIVKLFLMSNLS